MVESLFEKLKRLYACRAFTYEQIYVFVERGKITEEQFNEITGEENVE